MSENVVSIKIGEKVYTQDQAWNALRFVVKRGYVSQLTPNPDRAVLYPEIPPAKHVGGGLRYAVAPGIPSEVRIKLSNIDLPRGEAGDDYASLQKRVTILESQMSAVKIWTTVTDLWIAKIQNWYSWTRGQE